MKSGDDETKASEPLIIRRRGGGEEGGHHGGVWKIAYADFMTAMMAFFLVMWLINSSDKKTLTQVANYFNPMRLTDKNPSSKGLYQMESGPTGKEEGTGNSKEKAKPSKDDGHADLGKPKYTDEALFKDPPGVLEKLAGQARADQKSMEAGAKGGSEGRLTNGEAYRDPFDPAFRREAPVTPHGSSKTEVAGGPAKRAAPQPPAVEGAMDKGAEGVAPVQPSKAVEETGKHAGGAQSIAQAQPSKAPEDTVKRAEAERLESEIKQALARILPGTLPHIDVTVTEDGLLISLTDDYDFGMFAIASAEPRPATVLVMEKIAKVLNGRPEPLVLRGHTDGRPYKAGTYDNWRLSTARAHMAYYMLLRGGIEDKRFERVEGYADHRLRVPADPEAAQNRRIEILLRKGKS